MEKRALLAFVLSMAVFIIWAYLFGAPSTPPPQTETETETVSGPEAAPAETAPTRGEGDWTKTTEGSPGQAPAQPQPSPTDLPVKDLTVNTSLYSAVITTRGARLKSLTLNHYRTTADPSSPPKELVMVDSPRDYPLGLSFKYDPDFNLSGAVFDADHERLELGPSMPAAKLTLTFQKPNGVQVVRTFTFEDDSYLIGVHDKLLNYSDQTIEDQLILDMASQPLSDKERYAGFGAYIDEKLYEVKPGKVDKKLDDLKGKTYNLAWAGYEDQYFLAAILPEDRERTRINPETYQDKGVRIQFAHPPLTMPPNTQKDYQTQIFYGPKDFNVLKAAGHDLSKSIDFGWFDILSKPLLMFMTWLYKYVGNYGVAIIIITLIIKAIFWPLTAKSYKSMKNMQKLQPKIMKLREKYKDDRQKMNQEMMQLYRTYKVNPMGGCLPMVIQIPVFIALYRLLDYSLELRHAPFALWINDLSAPDRLFHFNVNIPLMHPPAGIPVLTLLMGASMLLQQKMTPTPGDPTQAKMMMLMPVFFTFIFINFPAGLVLYWLVNNLLSIGQQTMINRRPK